MGVWLFSIHGRKLNTYSAGLCPAAVESAYQLSVKLLCGFASGVKELKYLGLRLQVMVKW